MRGPLTMEPYLKHQVLSHSRVSHLTQKPDAALTSATIALRCTKYGKYPRSEWSGDADGP